MDKKNDKSNKGNEQDKDECDCPACRGEISGIGIPIPKSLFGNIIENMGKKPKTINEHYGVSDADYNKCVNEMLCNMIMHTSKSDTLDKFFKGSDAETRVKVIAYADALSKFMNIYDG